MWRAYLQYFDTLGRVVGVFGTPFHVLQSRVTRHLAQSIHTYVPQILGAKNNINLSAITKYQT